jgi:hypothetical protein
VLLETLKSELETLYEIRVPLALEDFLITDRRAITRLAAPPPAQSDEALYLLEEEDGAAMALFIDDAVLRRLGADDPREALHEGNLSDFCTALEGVSHFTYVAWRASHDRPVTQLELEMQAEVDKFATSAMLIGRQSAGRVPENLSRRLFEQKVPPSPGSSGASTATTSARRSATSSAESDRAFEVQRLRCSQMHVRQVASQV